MIARLIEDHRRIRAIVAELAICLEEPRPPLTPGFARCRWKLMRELSVHSACERQALGTAHGTDDSLDRVLRAHMLEWTAAAIQQRWAAYRVAARILLRRLVQRMDHEERAVFPKLA
jgi:hypothetical protein